MRTTLKSGSPLIVWCVIAALACCILGGLCVLERGEPVFFLLYLGFAGHIFCGLAGYLVFGRQPWRFWVPVAIPVTALFSAWITEGVQEWLTFAALVGVSTTFAGMMLRSVKKGGIERVIDQTNFDGDFQFGIRDLFIASAVVAILLTVLKSMSNLGQLYYIALSAICIGLIGILNLWALFGHKITGWKWCFILLSILLSGLALGAFIDPEFWLAGSSMQLANLITLGCLRAEGFRIVSQSHHPQEIQEAQENSA